MFTLSWTFAAILARVMHCNSKLLHQKILSNECAVVRNFLCAQVLLYELAVTSVALLVGLAISCHELWYKSIWQCCWCSLYQTVWIYTRYYQYAFIFPYFLYRLEVCSLFLCTYLDLLRLHWPWRLLYRF